jgi:hypothetical protein
MPRCHRDTYNGEVVSEHQLYMCESHRADRALKSSNTQSIAFSREAAKDSTVAGSIGYHVLAMHARVFEGCYHGHLGGKRDEVRVTVDRRLSSIPNS